MKNNIAIVEENVIYTKEEEFGEKLNNFFIDAVGNLDIESFTTVKTKDESSENIQEIVKLHALLPNVLKIQEHFKIV